MGVVVRVLLLGGGAVSGCDCACTPIRGGAVSGCGCACTPIRARGVWLGVYNEIAVPALRDIL